MNGLIYLDSFKFNSLRKFMYPVYSDLINSSSLPREEKKAALKKILTNYFIRLREFRNLSIEAFAEKTKLSPEEIIKFENGETDIKWILVNTYNTTCNAHFEYEYLDQMIREFSEPSIKENKNSFGRSILVQFGIRIPGFDLNSEGAIKGKLLEFSKK